MDKSMMSGFFYFGSKLVQSTFHAGSVGLAIDRAGVEIEWNLIKGKYEGVDFPVTFKQSCGKKMVDILDTGWPSLFLISDRMKAILEENELTGWKTFPIQVYDKKGAEIPSYYGFSITGHCAPIDYRKSEIIEKQWITPTGPMCKFYKGIFIDKWDGTDFFSPEDTYDLFITRRAADILKKNKITNMQLENLTEYETRVSNVPQG
jgi:hypothetical protein